MIRSDQGGREEKESFRSAEEESFQSGVENRSTVERTSPPMTPERVRLLMSAALMGSMERSRCDLWIMPCAQDQPWSPRRNRPVRTRMPGGVGPAADLLGQLAGTRFDLFSSVFPLWFLKHHHLLGLGAMLKRIIREVFNFFVSPLRPTFARISGK